MQFQFPFRLDCLYVCDKMVIPGKFSGATRETKFKCVAVGSEYALLYFDGRVYCCCKT